MVLGFIIGGLLMALGAVVLVLAVRARGNAQKPLSNRDLIAFCGATLALLLGFILIAYTYPKIYQWPFGP